MIWIMLIAGALAAPYTFQVYWQKRWFKVLWWIAIVMVLGGSFQSVRS